MTWSGDTPVAMAELAQKNREAAAARVLQAQAALTKAKDYGIVQFHLDGKKVGEPIDLYNAEVLPSPTSLGEQDLTAGDHTLTIEIVGANDKAIKNYMAGLDYVKLDPTN